MPAARIASQQEAELDLPIADQAGVRGESGGIAGGKIVEHPLLERPLQIDDGEVDADPPGDAAHPFQLAFKIRLGEMHEKALDSMVFPQHYGAGRRIDPPAHGYADTFSAHRIPCKPWPGILHKEDQNGRLSAGKINELPYPTMKEKESVKGLRPASRNCWRRPATTRNW